MHYVLEAVLLISIFIGVRWVINKKYFKVTAIVLVVFNALLIGQSIFSAINTGFFYSTLQEQNSKQTIGIPFSKDKQNFAGFDHSVKQMNIDSTQTTKSIITETSSQFMSKIKKQGCFFSSSLMHYADIAPDKFDNFIPFWDNSWKKWLIEVPLGNKLEVWRKRLYENAIFYSVPLFLKPKIYNNTEWLAYYKLFQEGKEQDGWKYSYEPYNFIRLLSYISVVKNETANDHGVSWGQFEGNIEDAIQPPASWTGSNPDKIRLPNFWQLNALLMVKDFNNTGIIKEDWRIMSNADAPSIIFDENNPAKQDSSSRTLPSYFTLWEGKITTRKKVKIHSQYEVKNNIFDLNNWKKVTE